MLKKNLEKSKNLVCSFLQTTTMVDFVDDFVLVEDEEVESHVDRMFNFSYY